MTANANFLLLTPMLTGRDGISEVSRQVARRLVRHAGASRVEVWALDGQPTGASDRLPMVTVRTASGRRGQLIRWACERLSHEGTNTTVVVMHAHLAPLALPLRARGARVAVFLHGIEAWRRLRSLGRVALASADCVVANSARTVERFRAANPWWGSRRVHVALLGIGDAVAPVRSNERPGFVLIVGRLSAAERYKGHDALIDAWPAVRGAVPDARLVIAGDGDDRPRLEARVRDANLSDAVSFVGRVDDGTLRGLYQDCAAFAMPSSGEGFGLAYLEAMREGKPCIALRAAAEVVEDGVTGILLESATDGRLAAALTRLLQDARYREQLGRAAAARVAAHFTEAAFGDRFSTAIGLHALTSNGTRLPVPAGTCA